MNGLAFYLKGHLNEMKERFPAILIGGPPHSGKSVLTYSLTHALRVCDVKHYVIRAAPDGEGDWSNEVDQRLVRELRFKGAFTPAFTNFVCKGLRNRHYPLLVDVGGRPTPEQERIFDLCTHAILLTPDAQSQAQWHALLERHAVPCIADLTSDLHGQSSIEEVEPVLKGTITGLERKHSAIGPVFEALVDKIVALLFYDPIELYHQIEALCDVETVIDLQRLARTFNISGEGQRPQWKPEHLPDILNYLPPATPLALYERGTNWIYAAVALLAWPAAFAQFDPRLGWIHAQSLRQGVVPKQVLRVQPHAWPDGVHLAFEVPATYLDHSAMPDWIVPMLPAHQGVILSGKLPYWLYTSLARTYHAQPWIAVYQPQLRGAVVVHSTVAAHHIGEYIKM